MRFMNYIFIAVPVAVLSVATAAAQTVEVFHWVDENGVFHFSQTEPPDMAGEVRKLALEDTTPADFDPNADIFGVEQQAQRMRELREDREQRRLARLEARQRAEEQRPVIIYQQQQPAYRFPGVWFPGLPGRPPGVPPMWPQRPVPGPVPSAPFLPSPGFDD